MNVKTNAKYRETSAIDYALDLPEDVLEASNQGVRPISGWQQPQKSAMGYILL